MSRISSPWLTVPQAREYLQMGKSEFDQLIQTEAIPSYRRSEKRIFVNAEDLNAYMRSLPSAASSIGRALRSTS